MYVMCKDISQYKNPVVKIPLETEHLHWFGDNESIYYI